MARGRARSSTRSAAAVLSAMRTELARGWPAGLTVLSGEDLYHLDRAQHALLQSLAPESDGDLALTVFGADEDVDVGATVAAARSAGMFSERRVVLVRDLTRLKGDPAPLARYAESPPRESFLIVRAPALDRRLKLHQALGKLGRMVEFAGAGPGEMRTGLAALAQEKGIQLDRGASDLLGDVCAGDFYRADAELEKLRVALGESKRGCKVGVEQVRRLVAGSGLLAGWEVADAVLARDRRAAAGALRKLLLDGEEPLKLLGGLAYRARVMLQAKALLACGAGQQQVLAATRAWGWKEALFAGTRRYTLAELVAFPAALAEADRTLKSRSLAASAVLEALVERLILGAGTDPAARA